MGVMGFLRWDLPSTASAYEAHFARELGDAFRGNRQKRKQLIYAYGLFGEKRYQEALEPLVSLLQRSENDEDRRSVLLAMALCASRLDRPDKAEELYRKLLELAPDCPPALSNLGLLLLRRNQYRQTEALYRRATELEPKNATYRLNLGGLYFDLGYYERAIPLLLEAARDDGMRARAAALLAQCNGALSKWDEAERWAGIAVERGQDLDQMRAALVRIRDVLHDPGEMEPEVAEKYLAWKAKTGMESILCCLGPRPLGRSYVGGETLGEAPLDENGRPLRQLAAIFCEEFPGVGLPGEGLIRIFIAPDENWGMDRKNLNEQKGFRVLYDREFDHLKPGPHPGGGAFPVRNKLYLSIHTRVSQPMPVCDYRFAAAHEGEPEPEFCEAVNDVFHRMGGYPYSYGADPRQEARYAHYDRLLFQLDTMHWDRWSVEIGNEGCMKFCIPSEKLAAGDFSDVLYWWD